MLYRKDVKLCLASFVLLPTHIYAATLATENNDLACYLATLRDTPTDEAGISACDAALMNNPVDRAGLLVNRADIRLRMRDYQGAISDSEEALLIRPALAQAHVNRGAGLVGLRLYDQAITALDYAIGLKPQKPEVAYFDRALAREGQGDFQGAYEDLKASRDLDPRFKPAIDELSRLSPVDP
jgi:tetratricopeptide (TPR) repeat protein